MAGGKRASMREGPLSQLFKRTDVDAPAEEREPSAPAREPERPEQPDRDDRGLDYAQPRIPSPKERLSAAFSHDIPHDVLERPEAATEREYRPREELPQGLRHGVRRGRRGRRHGDRRGTRGRAHRA